MSKKIKPIEKLQNNLQNRKQKKTWSRLDELMSELSQVQDSPEVFIEYLRLREKLGA